MISYTWELGPMAVKMSDNGQPNVVFAVNWRLTGQDEHYSSDFYGCVGVAEPTGDFTSWEDLTKDQVQGWVEAALGAEQIDAYKTSIEHSIELQKKPVEASLPPPWANG